MDRVQVKQTSFVMSKTLILQNYNLESDDCIAKLLDLLVGKFLIIFRAPLTTVAYVHVSSLGNLCMCTSTVTTVGSTAFVCLKTKHDLPVLGIMDAIYRKSAKLATLHLH